MNLNFFKTSSIVIFTSVFFIIFCFFLALNTNISNENFFSSENIFFSSTFSWPTPGYNTITSYFGYRNAPTSGASTYHSGIDIGAPFRYKHICYLFWYCNIYWF